MAEVRNLKYYKWVFDENKVVLVDKRQGTSIVLSMPMADSFNRACISFKNRYRIEQVKKYKVMLRKARKTCRERINKLKESHAQKEKN